MPSLFKDLYSEEFFALFIKAMSRVSEDFDATQFKNQVYSGHWNSMEFKQRMSHISHILEFYLAKDIREGICQLIELIDELKSIRIQEEIKYAELALIFIPDIIARNGIHLIVDSMDAFEKVTDFVTCEFAVRPFIEMHQGAVLSRMLIWATSENEHLRRLASEGCRPRLPWGKALVAFKKDPRPILPILEILKKDDSLYVRKSVANNLNDISKDNPEIVIDLAKEWLGECDTTDWIVKHACRTLLKAGHKEVMSLFEYASNDEIAIENFRLLENEVEINGFLEFSFEIHNNSAKRSKVRLEYGIYYLRKNGALTKKVFKISEKEYGPNSTTIIIRRQSFKVITTRKFYPGFHKVSIILNGEEVDERGFELKAENVLA